MTGKLTRRFGRMSPLLCAALFTVSALAPRPGWAQTPGQLIVITEPQDWQEGRAIVVPAGQSLRIVGWVTHPAGVLRVLVDGQPAHTQTDASGLVKFDAVVTAGASAKDVVVLVEPKASKPFSRTFSLGVGRPGGAAAAAAQAPAAAPAREPEKPVVSAPPAAQPQPQQPEVATKAAAPPPQAKTAVGANPWKGFTIRGLGYAAVAAGGLYLMTKQTSSTSEVCSAGDCFTQTETKKSSASLGMGLAGAAVVAGITDVFLTSRRASSASSGGVGTTGPDASVHLARAGVGPGSGGRVVALMELRF